MIKTILMMAFLTVLVNSRANCQTVLDTAKYKDAELFILKKGYDVQQRLQEIKSIEGKQVTVFEVSGKQNKIKLTYTGIAESAATPKFSDEETASLIVVKVPEANGMIRAYFPMTNERGYRIYLTEKMK